jgi:hypothetical protein
MVNKEFDKEGRCGIVVLRPQVFDIVETGPGCCVGFGSRRRAGKVLMGMWSAFAALRRDEVRDGPVQDGREGAVVAMGFLPVSDAVPSCLGLPSQNRINGFLDGRAKSRMGSGKWAVQTPVVIS